MADSRRAGMFKTCLWLGLLPLLLLGVGLLLAVIWPHFVDPQVAVTESMRRWPVNPERWHAHPSTLIWEGFGSCVVLVVAGVVFWIKGTIGHEVSHKPEARRVPMTGGKGTTGRGPRSSTSLPGEGLEPPRRFRGNGF